MKISITNACSTIHTGYGYVTSKIMRNINYTGHKLLVERDADLEFNFNLPKFFKFSDNPKSHKVGYMAWESTELKDGWAEIINSTVDELWVPNKWIKSVVEKYTDKEVYVFGHGLDDVFYPEKKERTDKIKFLSMGYPAFRKDIPHVIDSFLELYAGSKDHELTIKTYKKYNDFEINEPNIKILEDTMSYENLANLMRSHDALLYPSWGEGFGLIPFQAMATGTPAIITEGWADYTKYSQDLVISSSLENSPWSEHHPGKMFKADHEDFIRLIKHFENNLESIQEGQLNLAPKMHQEYAWSRVIKEHFDSVESRLML